jgi:hypothetical protein
LLKSRPFYKLLFPAFLAAAHLALAEADNAARQAAFFLILGFPTGLADGTDVVGVVLAPFATLSLAHLAFAAAEMAARLAALIPFFFGFPDLSLAAWTGVAVPRMAVYSRCSVRILSWISAALRSCFGVKVTVFIEAICG